MSRFEELTEEQEREEAAMAHEGAVERDDIPPGEQVSNQADGAGDDHELSTEESTRALKDIVDRISAEQQEQHQ